MNAPLRGRRYLRPRNIAIAVALILLGFIGWVAIESWRVYAAEPKATVDYAAQFRAKLERDLQQPSETGDRAWKSLEEALEIHRTAISEFDSQVRQAGFDPRDELDDGKVDFTLICSGDPMRPEAERERRALEALHQVGLFKSLTRFAGQGVGFRPSHRTTMMVASVHSDLSESRRVAKALGGRMRLCLLANDYDGVVESFESALSIGRTISHQPGIVSHLVGAAIHLQAIHEVAAELMEGAFPEEVCLRLLEITDRQRLADIAIALEGERIVFHDVLQWSFTDDGSGNGYMTAAALASMQTSEPNLLHAFISRFVLASRAETVQTLNMVVDRYIEQANLPNSKRWRTFDPEQFVLDLDRRHMLLALLMPALQKAVDNSTRTVQEVESLRIMLGLEIHHARHGRWPQSLDALVPDVLPELPRDPLHEGPFGYRPLELDAHGRGYVLYSFGLDQKDDGGVEDAGDPHAILRDRTAQGFDFVLSRPREKP